MKGVKTNAMRVLDAHKVAYQVHEYSPKIHSALDAAQALGLPAERVYKTLVVMRDEAPAKPLLVMVAGSHELDLRTLAKASGDKKLRMATQKEAEALTGLQVGGIGALALLNRGFEIWLERPATAHSTILINAGQRGINLEVSMDGLVRVTRARLFDTPAQLNMHTVLFDMDGLMIDSEPLAKEAWQHAVAPYGHTIDEAMFAKMLGLRQVECARWVCEWLALPVDPQELAAMRNTRFMEILPGRLQAMPGLSELMEWLETHTALRALVTSGVSDYVATVLRELKLGNSFSVIVTAEGVPRGKPAPDCYLLAAERLGRVPADCLVLEDAPNGIAAAKAAGCLCWAVPNAYTRALDLSAADRVLPSLHAVRSELARTESKRT
jgi:Cys-tRNA(Pro)/Cys-tRNA(Cys) deacylase